MAEMIATATPSIEETFLAALPKEDGKPVLSGGRIVIESMIRESVLGGAFLGRHTGLDAPVIVRVTHPGVRAKLKNF